MKLNHKSFVATFTLVELLIVIAILSILVSLIQPAIKNAISRAYTLSCFKNLHNMGAAQSTYAGDRDDYVTPGCMPLTAPLVFGDSYALDKPGQVATRVSWDDHLSQYLGLSLSSSEKDEPYLKSINYPNYVKTFHCPADPEIDGLSSTAYDAIRRSYTMSAGSDLFNSQYRGMSGKSWSRKFSEVLSASSTCLMTELDYEESIYGKYRYSSIGTSELDVFDLSESKGLHDIGTGTFNYLFVDLHVEKFFYLETIDASKIGTNNTAWGIFSIDPSDDPNRSR